MRPWIVLTLALLVGLAGLMLGRYAGSTRGERWTALRPPPAEADPSGRDLGQARLVPTREALRRASADPGDEADGVAVDGAAADGAALAAVREALRARQAAEREQRLEERRLEAVEWTRQRSARFADELDLPPGAELRIAEILLEADGRVLGVREEARALGSSRAGRDRLQEGLAQVRAWRDARFEAVFGPDLARRILAFEDNETTLGMSPEDPEGAREAGRPEGGG
jgi:hypothetical protein